MSSPHDVRISARAERDLTWLPEKIGAACLVFIIFNVDDERRRVDIVHIDHRGDVY